MQARTQKGGTARNSPSAAVSQHTSIANRNPRISFTAPIPDYGLGAARIMILLPARSVSTARNWASVSAKTSGFPAGNTPLRRSAASPGSVTTSWTVEYRFTGINSDLPGTVIAQVTQPVYDTVTGAHLLIPQGARLLGRYQSEVSFGQDRALVVWDRIMFPDGSSIRISEPGTDASGAAGVTDRTDHHWNRVFAAAGLATILGVGAELGSDSEDDISRAIRRGTTGTVIQAGQRAVDRSLTIQPTIRVRPGWPVRVLVTRDVILHPYTEGIAR